MNLAKLSVLRHKFVAVFHFIFSKTHQITSPLTTENAWSGVMPTLLMIVVICYGLWQGGLQLGILSEQITYSRNPLLVFNRRIVSSTDSLPSEKLYIENVGTDVATHISVRALLFYVTSDKVYSFEEIASINPMTMTSTSRQRKRNVLAPFDLEPSEEVEMAWLVDQTYFRSFDRSLLDSVGTLLWDVSRLEGGLFVLFLERSYRKKTDFSLMVDTTYLKMFPGLRFFEELNREVGGPKIIKRVNRYLQEGPLSTIYISREWFEFRTHGMDGSMVSRSRVPRK